MFDSDTRQMRINTTDTFAFLCFTCICIVLPEIKPDFLNIRQYEFSHSIVDMQLLHERHSLIRKIMPMARCLRDSIQLATAACVKEQRSIVYLKTVLNSRHDGERVRRKIQYVRYVRTSNMILIPFFSIKTSRKFLTNST